MTTKELMRNYIESAGGFKPELNPLVQKGLATIAGEVPYRLKLGIVLSELITFTSHLRKNIKLYDGTEVPCNAITFALGKSGINKDSSMNMVRKALSRGYDEIDQIRKARAKVNAEKMAMLEGKPATDWPKYFEKPNELQTGLGTTSGLLKYFEEIEQLGVGAASINSSEIGSELLNNADMIDILKTISVGYDLGKIPAKIIKSVENQTGSIKCLPINALLFGSEGAILYDASVKAKFKLAFSVQLARRSFFVYTTESPKIPEITEVDEIFEYRKQERERVKEAQEALLAEMAAIVVHTDQTPLELTEKAQNLFDAYLEYNNLESEDMNPRYPISRLARKHKQWLALKLSGNIAILNKSDAITEHDYIEALNIVEMFSEDLKDFEVELTKEPYEMFVEFCRNIAEDGTATITLHDLKKHGYITGGTNSRVKLEELVRLASSYDDTAIYTACDDGICYEKLIKTDVIGISYMESSGTKEERAYQCSASKFEFYETTFEELEGLLGGDYTYSPFMFRDGVRGKNNIMSGTKFLVLDVDNSIISDKEAHLMLSDINHHIARTSSRNNKFKFRVLIELDTIINIPDTQWKYFMEEVSKDLGINVDILPKSQMYFAYAGREVLSVTDAEPMETKQLLLEASTKAMNKGTGKPITKTQQKTMLDDPLETFGFAFNADNGKGSRQLIRAAFYAKDLGADKQYVVDLMHNVNKYWVTQMDEDRLEKTIISQIDRMF